MSARPAPADDTRVVDAPDPPHLDRAAGPSSNSNSLKKEHWQGNVTDDTDNSDDHANEENDIREAEEEIEAEREREGRAGEAGVSGWVARRLFRRRHEGQKSEVKPEAGAEERGDDPPLLVQPETRLLPILSGLVCPFSVLLDVPGITTEWYVRTEGNNIVATQPNPALLDAGQAVALAFGVLANAALIWRFLEHHPRKSTWVAMAALTFHDAISITIVTWFGVVHRFSDGFVYSDAFWLSVAATVASTVCNVTLALDLIRTKDFDKKGSGLTEKQRGLVIVAMLFFLYLGVGSLCYSFLIADLRFIDALYFTECILTSVGFGDILPVSTGSRIFTFFYAPVGIINLAILIAVARETIIESFEASYRSRRDRLAAKARERKEAIRKKQELARERRRRAAEESAQPAACGTGGQAPFVPLVFAAPPSRSALVAGLGASGPVAGAVGVTPGGADHPGAPVLSALERVESGDAARPRLMQFACAPLGWALRRCPALVSGHQHASPPDCEAGRSPPLGDKELNPSLQRTSTFSSTVTTTSLDQSFKTLKQQLLHEQRQEFRVKLAVAVTNFLVFWLVGSAVYSFTEDGWSFWVGLWFSFIYFTTLGLGDYTPKSSAGRAFFVCWALLGIASMTLLLSVLTESWSARYKSSLTDGRFKKALRRVNASKARRERGDELPQDVTDRLFARDGYTPLSGDGDGPPATAEELPEKIVKAIKGFHSHARYFMLGRNGQPPSQLRSLFAAAEDAEDGVDQLIQRGAASLAEAGAQGDTEHFLFLVSYERQFDLLLESAEQLASVLTASAAEAARLEAENERLQGELAAARDEEPHAGAAIPFFHGRPAGGFGDEEVEEELCEEVDDGEAPAAAGHPPGADAALHPDMPPPHLAEARHRTSSAPPPSRPTTRSQSASSPLQGVPSTTLYFAPSPLVARPRPSRAPDTPRAEQRDETG